MLLEAAPDDAELEAMLVAPRGRRAARGDRRLGGVPRPPGAVAPGCSSRAAAPSCWCPPAVELARPGLGRRRAVLRGRRRRVGDRRRGARRRGLRGRRRPGRGRRRPAQPAARRGDRVFEGDLFDALPAGLRGRVDVLIANAPVRADRRDRAHAARGARARAARRPRRRCDGLDVQRASRALATGCAGGALIETSVRRRRDADAMRRGLDRASCTTTSSTRRPSSAAVLAQHRHDDREAKPARVRGARVVPRVHGRSNASRAAVASPPVLSSALLSGMLRPLVSTCRRPRRSPLR